MRAKKIAILLTCLMASSLTSAADSVKPANQNNQAAPNEKPAGAEGQTSFIESLENPKPAAPSASASLPCNSNDPNCFSVSEADLKAEADLKPAKQLAPPKEIKREPLPPLEESLPVSEPAKMALRRSQEWAENPRALPSQGKDGRMIFTFGDSAPTIVCAPLRVCDLELEPGETVQGSPHIGDSVRWKIAPAVSAEGDQKVTHLIIKPTEPGLDTNLMIPTDRRTYHLRLVSSKDRYLARVAFEYPDNVTPVWQKMMQPSKNDRTNAAPATGSASSSGSSGSTSSSELPAVSVDRINFNYKVEVMNGKPRFKPVRVMDDGVHTFISMNEDMPVEEAPVLVLVDSEGGEQMVNYRLKGNIFTIDRMIDKVALISGTGRAQQRVEISREKKCVKRGFLGVFGRCSDE